MKYLHHICAILISILVVSCSNNDNSLKSYHIESESNFTDYDKNHVNDFNYFVDMADSIIMYNQYNDNRGMGRCFIKLHEHKHRASYWGSHTNTALKERIDKGIAEIYAKLDDLLVPLEVTYRINLCEVYITPKNGVVTILGFNNLNPFKTYNLSIDEDGYVVRTVRRDNERIINEPVREVSRIKDLSGEYKFDYQKELKIERIGHSEKTLEQL